MLRPVHVYGRWGNGLESLMLKNPNAISSRLGSILVIKSLIPERSYPERHTSLSHLKWQCEVSKVAQPAKLFATILTTWVQLLGTHRVGVNCLPQVVLWPPHIYMYMSRHSIPSHEYTNICKKIFKYRKILGTGEDRGSLISVQQRTENSSTVTRANSAIFEESHQKTHLQERAHPKLPVNPSGWFYSIHL